MFEKAIKTATPFTKPINTIVRYFNSPDIRAFSSTCIFLNNDAQVLTCKHVAEVMMQPHMNPNYLAYKDEILVKNVTNSKSIRKIAKKHNLTVDVAVELKNRIHGIGGNFTVKAIFHPDLDLAILEFQGFEKLAVTQFANFAADTSELEPGKFLCRIGYPFPEFDNFSYNKINDELEWTATPIRLPVFPSEGMLTRRVVNNANKEVEFEMSTPGLKGQSGGPVVDANGIVFGLQSSTVHLDLDFDVNMKVRRDHKYKSIKESALLHVGRCIHVDQIKDFLRNHNVQFQET